MKRHSESSRMSVDMNTNIYRKRLKEIWKYRIFKNGHFYLTVDSQKKLQRKHYGTSKCYYDITIYWYDRTSHKLVVLVKYAE